MFRLKNLNILGSKAELAALPEGKLLINTINAHSYNTARKDELFAEALTNGDVLIPDGVSIVKACRWIKAKSLPKERIAGWDLFEFEMNKLEECGMKNVECGVNGEECGMNNSSLDNSQSASADNSKLKIQNSKLDMLEVKNLHATIAGKEILRGINLTINDGEIHAIMGPNGSGKSTLSAVLTGNPLYEVTEGEAWFNGKNILEMKPEDRAHEGLFLSFQYPVEIPGVSMTNFLKAAVNEKRKYQGQPELKAGDFLKLMNEKRKIVELDSKFTRRSVNEGFSGGEKKRNEIFQMAMLEPKLAILDETDSGLDVDAMRIVADGVNKMHTPETSAIVITHYERLLDMIKPDVVHVLYKGRIVKTAGPELAKEIEQRGYDWIKAELEEE